MEEGAGAEVFESEAEPEEESEEGVVEADAGGVEDAGAPVPVSEGVEVRVMPYSTNTKRMLVCVKRTGWGGGERKEAMGKRRLTICSQIALEVASADDASSASHALTMHCVVSWTYCVFVQRHLLSVDAQPKRFAGLVTQGSAQSVGVAQALVLLYSSRA